MPSTRLCVRGSVLSLLLRWVAAPMPQHSRRIRDDMIAIMTRRQQQCGRGAARPLSMRFIRKSVEQTRLDREMHGVSGKVVDGIVLVQLACVDGWSQPALKSHVSKPPSHADCAKAEASVCARLAKPSQHGQIGTNRMEAVEQSVGCCVKEVVVAG